MSGSGIFGGTGGARSSARYEAVDLLAMSSGTVRNVTSPLARRARKKHLLYVAGGALVIAALAVGLSRVGRGGGGGGPAPSPAPSAPFRMSGVTSIARSGDAVPFSWSGVSSPATLDWVSLWSVTGDGQDIMLAWFYAYEVPMFKRKQGKWPARSLRVVPGSPTPSPPPAANDDGDDGYSSLPPAPALSPDLLDFSSQYSEGSGVFSLRLYNMRHQGYQVRNWVGGRPALFREGLDPHTPFPTPPSPFPTSPQLLCPPPPRPHPFL
jgi:hypothetical protein